MKNLKHKLLHLGLSLAFIGLGLNANAQTQENPSQTKAIVNQDVDKPGDGNTNPPVVLSGDEKIREEILM